MRGFFPPSVREVIVARLDRLTPNAFALLVAGAVLGQGITFEHLCQVADLAEQDGLSACHRRAVNVLQAAAAPAAALAYHALAAGLAEPAFRFCVAAGDEALGLLAVRDAITFYEQARHLLTESVQALSLEATLSAPEIEHLYTNLGRGYELNAEWEKARAVYTSLLAYAQDASQQEMESAALNRLAALAAQWSFVFNAWDEPQRSPRWRRWRRDCARLYQWPRPSPHSFVPC